MIREKWLGLIAALVVPLLTIQAQTSDNSGPPPAATAPSLSPSAAEVVRLAGAGTGDDVVLAYIQNSTATFGLSADQILYLRDIGVSSAAITAMLNRDNAVRNQVPAAPANMAVTAPPPQPPVPEPSTTPVEAPLTPPSDAPPPTNVSAPPVEVGYFYSSLSPYGAWVQLDGVGWCWQPRVVVINHAWRPYCDSGHWVYTDAGWFWQSDYSWGWAAFHYGRWYLHPHCGWVWAPDRVWSPAWVTWRYEGDHCGWAPLPPHADFDVHYGYRYNGVHVAISFDFGLHPEHFTFISLHDFHEHDFAHHRLPPTEVTKIYNHTTIINNYVVNNNTIVNQGIKVDRVQAATHSEFRKVAIKDVPAGSTVTASRSSSAKGDLAVYRPQLKEPVKQVNMVAQKVDDRHPVIQHPPVVASGPKVVMAHNPQDSSRTGSTPASRQPYTTTDRSTSSSPPQPAPNSYKSAQTTSVPVRPADQQRPGSATPSVPESSRTSESTHTSSQYYPKSYHQAAETHALPPMNTRPSESHSDYSNSQHRNNGSDPSSRSSNGSPKKSDQQ
jgi:hypothetical protein